MPDLGLAPMRKWIGGTLLAWKEYFVGPSPADVPPTLPYRCGTMLLEASPEMVERVSRAWQEAEDHFVAWVVAHPSPRQAWLEDVERLRRRQKRAASYSQGRGIP